jgi:hypothetical protein
MTLDELVRFAKDDGGEFRQRVLALLSCLRGPEGRPVPVYLNRHDALQVLERMLCEEVVAQ